MGAELKFNDDGEGTIYATIECGGGWRKQVVVEYDDLDTESEVLERMQGAAEELVQWAGVDFEEHIDTGIYRRKSGKAYTVDFTYWTMRRIEEVQ